MGSVSGETAQLIECGLQPPEHGVENSPELSQFIFGILDGQPITQPFGGYFLGLGGHRIDECKRLSREGVTTKASEQQSNRKAQQQNFPEFSQLSP